jgi:hypothetical protein
MYALKTNKKVYWLVIAVYVVFLIWLYLPTPIGYGRSIVNLSRLEFMWIPLILHALAWVFAGLAFLRIRE